MTLETDIKQNKPFRSEIERAIVNIIYTNNYLCDQQFKLLKAHGITLQQYNVLRILKGHSPEPITINGIIDRMLDKMSNASRLVDKLVQKKLVVRKSKKEDRRACDVIISKKGEDFVETLNSEMELLNSKFTGMNDDDLAKLNQLLDSFRDHYSL